MKKRDEEKAKAVAASADDAATENAGTPEEAEQQRLERIRKMLREGSYRVPSHRLASALMKAFGSEDEVQQD